jgi:hypothetical protein
MGLLQHFKRHGAAIPIISLALLWLVPSKLWSRIEQPPPTIDLTRFISTAPAIFRGVVLDVAVTPGKQLPFTAVARLRVERWYRGGSGSDVMVRYETGFRTPGHDCIDFKPGAHWLIFAAERNGHLEFVDDCYGAVAVSPIISPVLQHSGILAQIEADFTAGLADSDRARRLLSIQRLGGLKSPSSRPALHRVIERGDSTERNWATYAALRSGDTTVLSRVRDMFIRGDKDVPPSFLAWELSQLRDRSAVPGLIEIANTAPDSNAREYALAALGDNIQASEALPAIAARLADLDAGVRFYALRAMNAITHEPACTLQPRLTDDMIEPQIRQCLNWWNESGKRQFSSSQ